MREILPTTPWLSPEDQLEVVEVLYRFGIIKVSNNRDLPLKSGGTTDIYISLRDARNNPGAIEYISNLFAETLLRTVIDRFVEIPDSVSCFAGPISLFAGLPYLTIREQAKEGRVSDAKIIGNANPCDRIAIIDDVITDGASKIAPYMECKKRKLNIIGLIVLVDRQQGWQKVFKENGINMKVWPGMTLHDVRRCLIELDLLQRCEENVEQINPIIVALDGKNWNELLPILDQLRTTGCIFKVNDLVFAEGFDHLLPELATYGRVMVDLKNHDIPNTLVNTCARLRKHNPWAVTIHASGGPEMIAAAVKTFEGTATKVLAVTVLTSINQADCEEIYNRPPTEEVLKLAEIAAKAGAQGLVCSPQEVAMLHENYPGLLLVVPGIRSPEKSVSGDDQKRTGTPQQVMSDGADHIVMGRQILQAANPVAEVNRILNEDLQFF
ncbi:MAG: orotidine-5'-phosphate decarboxylase [Chitinivibrionales bacterium]|nr:orotidine-5'-phosphate decarboxylase [Chitinivibrionales bacterium]